MIKHHDINMLHLHYWLHKTMMWEHEPIDDDVIEWNHKVNTIKGGSWPLFTIGNADLKLTTTVLLCLPQGLLHSHINLRLISVFQLLHLTLSGSSGNKWSLQHNVSVSTLCLYFESNPTPKLHVDRQYMNCSSDTINGLRTTVEKGVRSTPKTYRETVIKKIEANEIQ